MHLFRLTDSSFFIRKQKQKINIIINNLNISGSLQIGLFGIIGYLSSQYFFCEILKCNEMSMVIKTIAWPLIKWKVTSRSLPMRTKAV